MDTAGAGPFARYLRLLGITPRPPRLDALNELVAAHITRVPFENLSKLHFRADAAMRLPAVDRFLDGLEFQRFGGTCYANNYHLTRLLDHLGYEVRLCGADMRNPDVHLVGIVRLDGREYLVDGGYGAPFLTAMPLDLPHELVIEWAGDRYVLRPRDPDGRSRLDLWRDGILRHGYRVNPAPRRIEEFARVIDDSFAPGATFMNALVIVRTFTDSSLVLNNRTLIVSAGASRRVEEVASAEALPAIIEARYGIPAAIAREVLVGLDLTMDAWG